MNAVTDDLIAWLNQQIDDDERWAIAASTPDDGKSPPIPGGVHWVWGVGDNWDHYQPDPLEEHLNENGDDMQPTLITVEQKQLNWGRPDNTLPAVVVIHAGDVVRTVDAEHIIRFDPARALREIAAKRAIIEAHQRIATQSAENAEECANRLLRGANWLNDEWAIKQNQLRTAGWQLEGYVRASRYALLCLALAYEHRPGYRDEWRLT